MKARCIFHIFTIYVLLFFSEISFAKSIIVKAPMDLQGREMVLSSKDKLVFKKKGCLFNGSVRGNGNRIVIKTKKPVFNNIELKGKFSNTNSYLSWWNCGEDITVELSSLLSVFCGNVHIDVSGIVSTPITIGYETDLTIDGTGSTIALKDVPGFAFIFKAAKNLVINNLDFKYISCNPGQSSHVGVLKISHFGNSSVKLSGVSIEGFDNYAYKPCGIDAILINNSTVGTKTTIKKVRVRNMIVKGDGKETNGLGSNYAISVDCHQKVSGKVEISDCIIENMYNVDATGKKIYEDTSGIYLGGAIGKNDKGEMSYCDWDAIIRDCHFNDISKRNIKIQGNNVKLTNLYSTTSETFLKSYKNMYVGIEGNNILVDGIYGNYDGVIVKMTGDNLTLRNMDCTSSLRDSKYAHVIRLDGTQHSVIENCTFVNDTYMFIYPTERGYTDSTIPVFHVKNCNLDIKHLIYCIKDYNVIYNKGLLVVEDCDIVLGGTYCYNTSGLAEIRFIGSRIKTTGRTYSRKKDGTPCIVFDKNSENITN